MAFMILATGLYINAWYGFVREFCFSIPDSRTVPKAKNAFRKLGTCSTRSTAIDFVGDCCGLRGNSIDGVSWSFSGTLRLAAILIFGRPLYLPPSCWTGRPFRELQ